MLSKILNLSKKLIEINSTKENVNKLNDVLGIAKKELLNFKVQKYLKNSIPSLLFFNLGKRPKKFKVILNAHLDVVPAKRDQFNPVEKNGRLYGRGTSDMKAAAAVEILVFKDLAAKVNYPLGLQLVTDEEIGGFNGVKHQIEKGVLTEFVLAGEPTNFKIGNKAKGIIWLKIKTGGKTGHAAYPWQGQNALWKMNRILNSLQKVYPELKKENWQTTVNLAKIETTNQTFNKVPDECTVSLDIRYIPEDRDTIMNIIKKTIGNEAEIEPLVNEPSVYTKEESKFLAKLKESIVRVTKKPSQFISKHGGSDVRHYTRIGSDGITFGPIGEGLHTDNEWVDIKSLEDYYQILKNFLLSL